MARKPAVSDFREAAVAASVDALAAYSGGSGSPGGDPLNAGVSYCLPALEDKRSALQRFKIGMILRLVFGIGGVMAGGALAVFRDSPQLSQYPDSVVLGIGLCCTVGGILVLLSAAVGQNRFLRKHLGERYDAAVAIPSPFKPAAVGVEDPATFSKLKAAPEDLCIAVFDVEGQRLIMEGLSHSYVIHTRDVVNLGEVFGGTSIGMQIMYTCGGELLTVVLTQENLAHELRRQTIGTRKSPLHKQVHATLKVPDTIDVTADR